MNEERMIQNVPKYCQSRAKRLIEHLEDYTGVTWNDNGEMIVDGKPVPNTKLIVFLDDRIRKAKERFSSNNLAKARFLEVSSETPKLSRELI